MSLITAETRVYINNLASIQAETGEISTEDLAWLLDTIEKADKLAVAARSFVDIAHETVRDLETEVADRDSTIEGISAHLDEVLAELAEQKAND